MTIKMKLNETTGERMKRELGGTILGLIIGLVLGLGAALAVAIYVAKVPSPFVNKGQSRTPDQDAVEAKKNKDWDPNAPLYGKNPAKPTATASAPAVAPAAAASGATSPVAPAVAGGPGTAVKPETPKPDAAKADAAKVAVPKTDVPTAPPPATSADPLGDLARAKSSSSGAEPFVYFVQVGAYRNADDAETQRAKLSLTGVEAKVTEREQSGRAIFRVRVGPFNTKDEAERSKEKLDGAGLDTALVRVQR
jgi:cell division protein FtsN